MSKKKDWVMEKICCGKESELVVQSEIVGRVLGTDYNAVYFCPACAPSTYDIHRSGKWTYVDMWKEVKDSFDLFKRINPNVNIVLHDLRNLDYPFELARGSFDLAFLNSDYAGEGVTHYAANYCLRVGGLLFINNGIIYYFENKEFIKERMSCELSKPSLLSKAIYEDYDENWKSNCELFLEQHPNYEVVFNPVYHSHSVLLKIGEDRLAESMFVKEKKSILEEGMKNEY